MTRSRRSQASQPARAGHSQRAWMLAIAQTDNTFELVEYRGRTVWAGKCIHCNGELLLEENGQPISRVTVEHLRPKVAGGTDEPLNTALSCARCNNQKGVRHDRNVGVDPRADALVEQLLRKRKQRWREAG